MLPESSMSTATSGHDCLSRVRRWDTERGADRFARTARHESQEVPGPCGVGENKNDRAHQASQKRAERNDDPAAPVRCLLAVLVRVAATVPGEHQLDNE